MAEEYKDLSTGTKRVEYYNEKVKELKASNPELAEVTPAAFDIASDIARRQVFGGFGMINFPEDPRNQLGDPKVIDETAEKVIFGTARFIGDLKKDSPKDLIHMGIDSFRGFDNSKAANDLLGVTKMSFEQVRSGLDEVESAIRADDKSADDPFEGKSAFKNLKPEDISALLDATVIKFIKEIGLKRADEERDKEYLDRAEKAISSMPKVETPAEAKKLDPSKLNTSEDPEYMARLEKARREDALMDSVDRSKTGAKISTDKPKPISEADIKKPAEPAATPAAPATPATPAATPAPPATQAVSVTPTPAPKGESTAPQVLNLSGSGSSSSGGDFSLLKAMGISDADLKSALNGANSADVEKALNASFGDEGSIATSMAAVSTPSVEPIKAPEQTTQVAKTTSVSEPTKLSSTPTATPPPPPASAAETKKEEEKPSEENAKETPKESTKKEEMNKNSSEKSSNETNQEMATKIEELTKSNGELLGVMRQILSTLQGPLIVTESKHNFH